MNVNSVTDLWFKKSKIHAHCVSRKWTWTALSEMALLALERSKSLVEIRANSTPCHLDTHSWTTSLKVRPLNMKPPEHCHLFLSMWRSHEAEAGNKAAQRLRPQSDPASSVGGPEIGNEEARTIEQSHKKGMAREVEILIAIRLEHTRTNRQGETEKGNTYMTLFYLLVIGQGDKRNQQRQNIQSLYR